VYCLARTHLYQQIHQNNSVRTYPQALVTVNYYPKYCSEHCRILLFLLFGSPIRFSRSWKEHSVGDPQHGSSIIMIAATALTWFINLGRFDRSRGSPPPLLLAVALSEVDIIPILLVLDDCSNFSSIRFGGGCALLVQLIRLRINKRPLWILIYYTLTHTRKSGPFIHLRVVVFRLYKESIRTVNQVAVVLHWSLWSDQPVLLKCWQPPSSHGLPMNIFCGRVSSVPAVLPYKTDPVQKMSTYKFKYSTV
jgi:hypothetical protein